MKTILIAALIVAASLPAKAQLFSSEALGGAVIGGVAGGIIGHNSGRRTAEGIGIGAGAGLLLGALTASSRRDYNDPGVPYASEYRSRPNYAVTGAVLGGVAGGVIGHNSGRHTAEGIAIGAGAGLLLGGIAEHEARKRETLTAYARPAYVMTAPATVLTTTPVISQAAQPSPTTVVENSYAAPAVSSPMNSANALFGR